MFCSFLGNSLFSDNLVEEAAAGVSAAANSFRERDMKAFRESEVISNMRTNIGPRKRSCCHFLQSSPVDFSLFS